MVEDCDDIPIGIVISISLYALYMHAIENLMNMYNIDSRIIFYIYFVPLIIFYIEIPIILKKSNNWQKYVG